MFEPLDRTPYPRASRSRPIQSGFKDGSYVYVMDEAGTVHVLLDGPHRHPKILGEAKAVRYAGDLTIGGGTILDVTNLSGTFDCDDPHGLIEVAAELRRLGFVVSSGAVRFFPRDGSRPQKLQ